MNFIIDIPSTIDSSFYCGKVFVGLKENAFQPSSPIRHITELNGVLDSIDVPDHISLASTLH